MTSISKVLLAVVLVSIVLTPITIVFGESQWTRYGSSPVLSAPTWAPGGAIRPRVVYDGNSFKMWFTGLDAKGNALGIGYATSTDGTKWVANAQQVFTVANDWEGSYITIGSVVWTGSEFMLWYRGVGGQQGSAQANGAVGLATSTDGVTWTRYSGNPVMTTSTVDSDFLSAPYVIKVGSSFKMWYTCQSPAMSGIGICYASSSDGIKWTKAPSSVLQASEDWEGFGVYSPSVIYDGTTYGMWYTGGYNPSSSSAPTRIGYASSKDGISWTRDPNLILSLGASNAWDAWGVENPCAIQSNNAFFLYYDGWGKTATSFNGIGLAQSPSDFALPETTAPTLTAAMIILIVASGLSLRKHTRT